MSSINERAPRKKAAKKQRERAVARWRPPQRPKICAFSISFFFGFRHFDSPA